ncbi:MAG: patatin-like phospholipase family protein [Ignavibacteria bacterium]|nr:patatin-like phospholipase family protein [Ignavibacteria bacterium]
MIYTKLFFEHPFPFLKFVLLLFAVNFITLSQNASHVIKLNYISKNIPYGLTCQQPEDMPKVALALSGGGSRGLSQIGVLRALKEADIPLHLIVGTSMGSIVGGLYSAGYDINDLDSIARTTNWDDLLASDRRTNRRDLFVDQKLSEDKSIIALRLDKLKPIFPSSINDGQKFSNYLNLLALQSPFPLKDNFDELSIPFRAVSTNLETGDPHVLKSGLLTQALRASSSVTFFLSPVRYDSLILVDGGLVANIPVEITKQEGADIIIAVNTTSDLHPRESLNFPWIVADQVVSIPIRLLNKEQLDEADFVITPNLERKLSSDFTSIDSLIELGYQATLPLLDEILMAVENQFKAGLKSQEVFYKKIIISEQSKIGREYLTKYINKDSVSSVDILFDLYQINKSLEYESLYAVVDEYEDYSILHFEGKKKPLIRSYSFDGINLISTAEAEKVIIDKLINQSFTGGKVAGAIKEIIRKFRSQGYALAELDSLHFDADKGHLYLHFKEGIISEIKISGNVTTEETIISREFPLKAGNIFYYESIQQGLRNLRSTNLFDNIILSVEKSNDSSFIIINVTEKVSTLMRMGFKVDNENKAQLNLDIRDENVFGTGTELGTLLYLGDRSRYFSFEHKANRIFDTYITYSLNAYYAADEVNIYKNNFSSSGRTFSRDVIGEYQQVFYGFSFSLGTQVKRFGNVILKGKYELNDVHNLRDNLILPNKNTIVSLRVSSTVDTQDKYPYANNGLKITGYYETAQKILGGNIGFINFGIDYKGYFTVYNSHTIATAVRLGLADKTLPLSQQYSLGGQNSFFGMRDDELRGRQVMNGSLEYRYFLPIQIIVDTYISLRYDLGSIWANQEQIRFKDLRHGIGTTLSFNTPIGPADFSLGRTFLLTKDQPLSKLILGPVSFYFSIGFYY